MRFLSILTVLLISLLAAACAPVPVVTPEAVPTQEGPAATTAVPTQAAPAATTVVPTQENTPAPDVLLVTYTDPAGFSLDYPEGWQADDVSLGDRARMVQLTTWQHAPGSVSDIPAGETILQAQVQSWDPKGDLAAFVAQRQAAWEASGVQVLEQGAYSLSSGQTAMEFTVQGADGAQGYFLFAVLGEQYLALSGNGDLAALRQVAHTLRIE